MKENHEKRLARKLETAIMVLEHVADRMHPCSIIELSLIAFCLWLMRDVLKELRRKPVRIPSSVEVRFRHPKGKGAYMATVSLDPGQKVSALLEILDQNGKDLRQADPNTDAIEWSANNTDALKVDIGADGTVLFTNILASGTDVDVSVVGIAAGFEDTQSVHCVSAPPPPVATSAQIRFGQVS
jgi:hypothetical protein